MRHLPSILIALLTLPVVPAIAQPADPLPRCTPTPPALPGKVFKIDAATLGTTTTPTGPLRLRDKVTVLVVNKNPLLFDYRLEGREVVVADTGLAEGIALLFPFAKAFGGTGEAASPPPAPPETAEEEVEGKPFVEASPCERLRQTLDEGQEGLGEQRENTRLAASKAQTAHAQLVQSTATSRQTMLTAGIECPTLRDAISTYRTGVRDLQVDDALPAFDQALEAYGSAIEEQREELQRAPVEAQRISMSCLASLEPHYREWQQRLDVYEKDFKDLVAFQKRLTTDLATAEKNVAAINAALAQAQPAFFSLLELGPYERPTDVFVKLSSRPAADPKATHAQLGEWKLNFGGTARFALAAGAAYSSLGTRTFERIHGFARDREGALVVAQGKEVSGQIVGIDEESDHRVGPLLMLHTRIGSDLFGAGDLRTALHFSFGLSAGILDDDLTGNLLVGPSISFAEERLFLTVGGYYGKSQTLGGNLFVGGLVPEEVTEIPAVREGHWKLGAAVTYRFEVGKKKED